jgi:hypothetical protein
MQRRFYPALKLKILVRIIWATLAGSACWYLLSSDQPVRRKVAAPIIPSVSARPSARPIVGLTTASATIPSPEPATNDISEKPADSNSADELYYTAILEGLVAKRPAEQEATFCNLVSAWIHDSPTTVELLRDEIAERVDPNLALRLTAQIWAEEDPEGAKEWALRNGNGGQRLKILASVAYQQARRDPAAAADYLKAELDRTPFYPDAIAPLLGQWAAQDHAAALAWAHAQPEGDLRDQLIKQLDTPPTLAAVVAGGH